MKDFWVASGHHLLDRDRDGRLSVTDAFLKAYLARPELLPPETACEAELRLHHELLMHHPRRPVAADEIAAIEDPDARENWRYMVAFRDRLLAAPSLEAAYLALVRPWFEALGAQLEGRLGGTSRVIGIQIENEIYDQPDHIATLKSMAIEAGLVAPLYMATAWGGAQLPADEVLPMFGGYADGFWVDADAPWDDTFREHFFFRHVWDDPGIGADVREAQGDQAAASPGAPAR